MQAPLMFKTLIVDDNAAFRRSLNDTLTAGFPSMLVAEAGDGAEARQQRDAFDPDLVFMDIKLPDSNGLDLTREFKASCFEMIIIVITGHDMPEYRLAACECGASHFLSKSLVTQAEILSLVGAIVTGWERQAK